MLHSTPKDRKLALRSLRGLVGRVAREPFGHAVLLTACECVDDTVTVGKTVLAELAKGPSNTSTSGSVVGGTGEDGNPLVTEAVRMGLGSDDIVDLTPAQLLRDPHGARVALFVLVGRSTRYQEGHVLKELAGDDTLRKQTSKKDDAVRFKELRTAVAPMWLEVATAAVDELLRSVWGSRVLCELIRCPEGERATYYLMYFFSFRFLIFI